MEGETDHKAELVDLAKDGIPLWLHVFVNLEIHLCEFVSDLP